MDFEEDPIIGNLKRSNGRYCVAVDRLSIEEEAHPEAVARQLRDVAVLAFGSANLGRVDVRIEGLEDWGTMMNVRGDRLNVLFEATKYVCDETNMMRVLDCKLSEDEDAMTFHITDCMDVSIAIAQL